MADAEQLACIRRGKAAWNAWRDENPNRVVDLTEADLSGLDFSSPLGGDATVWAKLRNVNLRYSNLSGANLSWSALSEANLSKANLSGANLSFAVLRGTNLTGADLSQANLIGAFFWDTVFGNTILRDARGLDACSHGGPSVIDHQTLSQSWPLPLVFLRGCGLPDPLITYLPSLLSEGAIQFYSCFISYSTKDQEFADRLYADLQNKGVRCWFAPHDVQGGRKLHEQIDEAIRRYERLLLILSPNSMASKWVKTEIRNARKRELVEKRRVLFPVRLAPYEALRDWNLFDADEGEDLAVEIREYYIPDFSRWKNHDLYVKEFGKLLRDLRADAGARESPPMPSL